jgi:hypothetical protein
MATLEWPRVSDTRFGCWPFMNHIVAQVWRSSWRRHTKDTAITARIKRGIALFRERGDEIEDLGTVPRLRLQR